MRKAARGYIASGALNGSRTPQHLQNQIIKSYCESNQLIFVLSRAEYWINGNTKCQLWAALKEKYQNIVFFTLWQMPVNAEERIEIYEYCIKNNITLHFATERMSTTGTVSDFNDLELLIQSNLIISEDDHYWDYLGTLKEIIS